MNVLFINPPYTSRIQEFLGSHGPPIGFESMSYQLKAMGHEMRIVDCATQGLTLHDTTKITASFDPGVVGITSTTPSFHVACQLAQAVMTSFIILILALFVATIIVPFATGVPIQEHLEYKPDDALRGVVDVLLRRPSSEAEP